MGLAVVALPRQGWSGAAAARSRKARPRFTSSQTVIARVAPAPAGPKSGSSWFCIGRRSSSGGLHNRFGPRSGVRGTAMSADGSNLVAVVAAQDDSELVALRELACP